MGDASTATTTKPKAAYKNWPNDAGFSAKECPTPVELKVIGTFPPQVAGTLYRNGPGYYKIDTEKGEYARSHWFDGFAQLHRFQIIPDDAGSCRVYYNSRNQVDELIERARSKGSLDGIITFAQKRDPCESVFQKVKTVFQSAAPGADHMSMWNVSVTVKPNMPGMPQGKLTSLTDANQIQHADMETLEPTGVTTQRSLHPDLKGPLSCAHARYDPVTGDMYNYNLDFGPKGTYRVFQTSAETSKTEIIATISAPSAYIHSFFMSEDFIILCIWPSYFTGYGASILWERNVADCLKFDPTAETKWYVIDRKGGRGHVATYQSPAFFSFHTANAFQEASSDADTVDIYCDIAQQPDDSIIQQLYYESLLSTGSAAKLDELQEKPSLVRYKLASVPTQGKARKDVIPPAEVVVTIPDTGELPTINPLFVTKKQRYVYETVSRGYSSFVDGLAKIDMETKEIKIWGKEPKPHTPGEAVFIPDGTRDSEDAGYLLSVVLDGETGTSYLVCLNARDMTEVARAEHDQAIALGLHGTHLTPAVKI